MLCLGGMSGSFFLAPSWSLLFASDSSQTLVWAIPFFFLIGPAAFHHIVGTNPLKYIPKYLIMLLSLYFVLTLEQGGVVFGPLNLNVHYPVAALLVLLYPLTIPFWSLFAFRILYKTGNIAGYTFPLGLIAFSPLVLDFVYTFIFESPLLIQDINNQRILLSGSLVLFLMEVRKIRLSRNANPVEY